MRLGLFSVVLLIVGNTAVAADLWQPIAPNLAAKSLETHAAAPVGKRFASLPPAETGIDFAIPLDWDHPRGLLFTTGYATGSIAVGDVDGNGLPDVFFSGGPQRSRLYFQERPWRFTERKNIGLSAAESATNEDWNTGAALLDIDNDGDLDLYVCKYDRPNQLYINRGDGTFVEQAAEYGLDIVDACLMPSLADFDRDGDLDIYLACNRYLEEHQFRREQLFYWHDGQECLRPFAEKYFALRKHPHRTEQLNMWAGRPDRLLRNEGPGKPFTDVSERAPLVRGDTLSATWWDYDHDGWPDLYVAHDLAAPDQLLHNRGDGTFEDVALSSLPHMPWLAMGSSAGDINNDGLVDFLVADMAFRTHFKDKAMMGDMTAKFRSVDFFPHDQLMRNALYLNSGTEHFQEAAYLAGLAATDWTWSAKLADLDNDGRLDALFTNGSSINLANVPELEAPLNDETVLDTSLLRRRYRQHPPVAEQNLAYRNAGNLHFEDQSEAWGLDHTGVSMGAVHADLDRDGDLDLIVMNLNEPPLVYRNDSSENGLLVELQGKESNRRGIGAEIEVLTAEGKQVRQNFPVAGFQSCQEDLLHFGLGTAEEVQLLIVRWPSGHKEIFESLAANQLYQIEEQVSETSVDLHPSPQFDFAPLKPIWPFIAAHHEEPFDDFAAQPLLPNRLSQLGPPLAWGDIDSDGDLDLFLGEGSGWMSVVYRNDGQLNFTPLPQVSFAQDEGYEDRAAKFLDANSDGHLDLLIGSGSVEAPADDELYRDRLYLGDGQGNFVRAHESWLPDLKTSTGALAAADYDRDGDVDVFVGGRSIPGNYPLPPEHGFLVSEGNHFRNALAESAPELTSAGMVTAAEWADFDGDGWLDLLVATDWGPVRLYFNREGKLVEATDAAGLAKFSGWWQSIACGDLDGDGDTDFVAGNFGLNTKYRASADSPVLIYYGDYAGDGQHNIIEASYEGDVLFPLRGKSCSSAAMPHLRERFTTYEDFAKATLAEIYTPQCLESAKRFEVNTLASAVFLNDGAGKFSMRPLPAEVQLSPVFALAITDLSEDGIPDLFCGQNFFTPQRETGPLDGGLSVLALGRGDGSFVAVRPDQAGIVLPDDVKAVATVDLDGDGKSELLAAANNGPLRIFTRNNVSKLASSRPPQTPWLTQNLSLAEQFLGSRQHTEAIPYLRRALKASPNDPHALLLYSRTLRKLKQFRASRKFLELARTISESSSAEVQLEAAQLEFALEHYERCQQLLQLFLAEQPGHPGASMLLAKLHLEQGQLDRARSLFKPLSETTLLSEAEEASQVAKVFFEQGKAAWQAGNQQEAINFLQRSRQLDARPETLLELAAMLETAKEERVRDPWLAEWLRKQAKSLSD